jgi:hypothetical protein
MYSKSDSSCSAYLAGSKQGYCQTQPYYVSSRTSAPPEHRVQTMPSRLRQTSTLNMGHVRSIKGTALAAVRCSSNPLFISHALSWPPTWWVKERSTAAVHRRFSTSCTSIAALPYRRHKHRRHKHRLLYYDKGLSLTRPSLRERTPHERV